MFWNIKTQNMHSSEFLRYQYYFLENVALLEVLPWKQAIKQKFLSPISNILKTCAKNAMALFLNRVTSVLLGPFLLRKVLLCVLWWLNLPTGNTFLSLHPNAGCIIYSCIQEDSHIHSPAYKWRMEGVDSIVHLIKTQPEVFSLCRRLLPVQIIS